MYRILLLIYLTFIGCGLIQAKDTPVAGWGVYAMGDNRHHLTKINGDALATMTIHDGILVFALWETKSGQSLGSAIIIDNLYVEQSAAEGNSFIGMKSKVRMADNASKSGILYLSVSKSDGGGDVIHFDFGDEDLYIIGELIEEDMASTLAKLGSVGISIKNGAKLKVPLEEAIR